MKSKNFLRTFLFLFILLTIPVLTFPQSESIITGSIETYKNGKIVKTDKTIIRGKNVFWDSQILTYMDKISKQKRTIPMSEIDRVIRVGNYAIEGALALSATALLVGLLAVEQVNLDPNYVVKDEAGAIITTATLGGLLAGAFIGSKIAKEKTVFSRNKVKTQISLIPQLIQTSGKRVGISFLTLSFSF